MEIILTIMDPPFKPGDVVMIIPKSGCSIGAECVRVPLVVERCEQAPVDDAIVWDLDLEGCPYLIIYPWPEEFDIIFADPDRDQKI